MTRSTGRSLPPRRPLPPTAHGAAGLAPASSARPQRLPVSRACSIAHFRDGRTREPCVASGTDTVIAMVDADVGGEDDHRRRSEFRTPFQPGAQLPSGHVRKTQIDHDAIRGMSECGREGVLTTARDMNVNAASFQCVLAGVGMITDGGGEQNVCRVRHHRVLPGAVNAPADQHNQILFHCGVNKEQIGGGRGIRARSGVSRGVPEDLSLRQVSGAKLAEGEGFEPPIPFRVQRFSRPSPSTARPSLRARRFALLSRDSLEPVHVRAKGGGNGDGAVLLLVVLENRD